MDVAAALNAERQEKDGMEHHMTSIVILSYHTLAVTKLCIESIRACTEAGSYEIIVVDNGSQDGSVEYLKKQSDVRCIFNQENQGFPRGCNQGMRIARGDEILLLNSDTVVTAHWLEQLRAGLYSARDVGAVSCVTNYCSNGQQIGVDYHSLEEMQAFAASYNHTDPSKWEERTTLVGFCLLFRRAIYDYIGGLDERFSPGNFEDDDYCIRIWQAGYRCLLLKDTFIHHFGSVSFARDESPEVQRRKAVKYNALLQRNAGLFREKWNLPEQYKSMRPSQLMPLLRRNEEQVEKRIMIADLQLQQPAMGTVKKDIQVGDTSYTLLTAGHGTYAAQMIMDYGSLRSHILVGRYTSIGYRVIAEIGSNHNHQLVTTYPFRDFMLREQGRVGEDVNHFYESNHYQIMIGNDVWVGEGVKLLGGIRIGNGAVIGAGAVVAKDVPPYAVVVGNPARVVKYRFSREVIERLERIKWWYWDEATIRARLPEMADADTFSKRYDIRSQHINNDVTKFLNDIHAAGGKIYGYVLDFQEPHPLWEKVLDAYLTAFDSEDKTLLLLEVRHGDENRKELQVIQQKIEALGDAAPNVMEHVAMQFPSLDVLPHLDFYVTNRTNIASLYVDYAELYGVAVISGCDYASGLFGHGAKER